MGNLCPTRSKHAKSQLRSKIFYVVTQWSDTAWQPLEPVYRPEVFATKLEALSRIVHILLSKLEIGMPCQLLIEPSYRPEDEGQICAYDQYLSVNLINFRYKAWIHSEHD